MEHGGRNNFIETFNHQTEGVYRPETVVALQRLVKMGRITMETCIELLELVEYDRMATDAELATGQLNLPHEELPYNLPDSEGEALPPLPDNPNYARLYEMFNRPAS